MAKRLKTVMVGNSIWFAVIHHKHGVDVRVTATKKGLFEQLYKYVAEWWAHEMGDDQIPEDRGAAVERYFERAGESGTEYYESGTVKLGP